MQGNNPNGRPQQPYRGQQPQYNGQQQPQYRPQQYQQQQYQQFQQQPQYQQYQQQPQPQEKGLRLTDFASHNLQGAAKWINFIGILAAIFCGILLLFSLYLIFNGLAIVTLPYLLVIALYIYPILKSLGMKKHVDAAIASNNNEELAQGLGELKGLATFMGVLMIIALVVVVIALIVTISTAGSLMRMI